MATLRTKYDLAGWLRSCLSVSGDKNGEDFGNVQGIVDTQICLSGR